MHYPQSRFVSLSEQLKLEASTSFRYATGVSESIKRSWALCFLQDFVGTNRERSMHTVMAGLPVAKAVVEAHGGTICFQSLRDPTEVAIQLPRSLERTSSHPTDQMKTRPNILIVDDDLGAMRYVSIALEQAGYRVKQVCTVTEAIDFLVAYSQTLDGVILDVMLPSGRMSQRNSTADGLSGGQEVFGYLQSMHPESLCSCFRMFPTGRC